MEQLRLVHSRLTHAKASGQHEGGSAVVSAAKNVPFAFSAWAIRLLARLPQKAVVALTTNVPGPRGQQKLMGRRVLEILPIPPIALQLRTGIAMLSYADDFIFGITADYDTAPDIEALARGNRGRGGKAAGGQPRHDAQALIAAPRVRSRCRPIAREKVLSSPSRTCGVLSDSTAGRSHSTVVAGGHQR